MTVAEVPTPQNLVSQGRHLFRRIRDAKAHVFVHPYRNGSHYSAFAWLLTDNGRESVNLHALGVLIQERLVQVQHVFGSGDLLYQVAN